MTVLMRYKPHHGEGPTKDNPYRGMKAFLLSDDVQKWADSAAKAIAQEAARLTARSKGPGPHMADQYAVVTIPPVVLSRERNARRAAAVVNHSDHAAAYEFGTSRQRGRRPLGRAGALHGEYKPGWAEL